MESTGIYWQPIWNLLEGRFELLLANARHIKAVPGRKTDVRDCEWIADLLRHGLLEASFVPPGPSANCASCHATGRRSSRSGPPRPTGQRRWRAPTSSWRRWRPTSGRLGARHLKALVGGATDPGGWPSWPGAAAGRRPACKALVGSARTSLPDREQLSHLDDLDGPSSARPRDRETPAPLEGAVDRLDTIPGVGRRTAEIVARRDRAGHGPLPGAQRLLGWDVPRQRRERGRRLSGRTRHGNKWLRTALVEAAHRPPSARHLPWRAVPPVAARRGKKRALGGAGRTRSWSSSTHILTGARLAVPRPRCGPTSTNWTARASSAGSPAASKQLGYAVTLRPDAA